MTSLKDYTFRDPAKLGEFVWGMTILLLVLNAISFLADLLLWQSDSATPLAMIRAAQGVLSPLVDVVGAIHLFVFLKWLYRVVRNAHAVLPDEVREGRVSPPWAVGWSFVPIMNIIRPFQAVIQAWEPYAPDGSGKAPGIALLWWRLVVVSIVLSFGFVIVMFAGVEPGTNPLEVIDSPVFASGFLFFSAIGLVTVYLQAQVVKRLSEDQSERWQAVSDAPPPSAPPKPPEWVES